MEKKTKKKVTTQEEFKEIFSTILKDYCDIKKEAIELGYNSDAVNFKIYMESYILFNKKE